jgi:branched-chain amino acid transport system ATP-binding protein
MLEVRSVVVSYARVVMVLHGVSLEVGDSSIVALLGANGAGKSTMLKAISGLLSAEEGQVISGSIEFDGHCIDRGDPRDIARMGIIQAMEGRANFEHLTVEQNLVIGASIRRDRAAIRSDLDMVFDYFPRLKTLRHQMSGYLSGGEQQMLVIGRSIMARPKLLLLDEPSLGLGPLTVHEIYEIVKRLNAEEKTAILLVEQNVRAALSVASYGYVMENGKIVLEGPADRLKDNEDIKEFYLGSLTSGARKNYRQSRHYKRRKLWSSSSW